MDKDKAVESYLFASDRERLAELVTKMGQKVVSALKNSVDAFINRDGALAEKILAEDRDINFLDEEIDLECLRAIAARRPVRDELRFIFAVLKTTTDLERVGDHAVNIARQALRLGARAGTEEDALAAMCGLSAAMMKDVLAAFNTSDGGAAEEICRRDDRLDAMYEELTLKLMAAPRAPDDPSAGGVTFAQMMVARYLERVGDHCTNIAERVYFMDKGQKMPER